MSVSRIILAIATTGRRSIIGPTIRAIVEQSRQPDLLIVRTAGPADLDPRDIDGLPFPAEAFDGPKGLCVQRNAILDRLDRDDVVVFLDDDFLLAPDFLAQTEALFAADPSIVVATGQVLADGILGPGYDHAEGAQRLADLLPGATGAQVTDTYNAYGCNMAIRVAPVRDHGIRFDERLPFYGWLEDLDFSRQLAPHGRIVKSEAMKGVHLGTKTGRSPGKRLGYSQVANPIYLARKGTMAPDRARRQVMRNLAANAAKTFRPEPWVDRIGRLRGNLMALGDWALGRLDPERVRDLS